MDVKANDKTSTLGVLRAERRAEGRARVVNLGEGRDPREGVAGGEILPEGLKTEDAPKPPQPRGLVGFTDMPMCA